MASSLLDQLIAQYGNGPNNPYATQQPQPVVVADDSSSQSVPVSTLIDLLGRSSNNPYANMGGTPSTGAPMGYGGGGVLQTGSPAAQPPILPAPRAASRSPAQPSSPAQSAPDPTMSAGPNTLPDIQLPVDGGPSDVTVDANGNASDAWQPNPNGGGLISALIPAAQNAASSPTQSKSLLETLGSTVSNIGQKLTNLSPNASQALIASGLTMLAGNDGTRNLGQLVGLGGIAGLNSYDLNQQEQAQNALARQKLLQTANQQQFDNALAVRKQLWDENKPITLGQDQSLYGRTGTGGVAPLVQAQPGVVRTTEVQGPDGNTYTVQLDRNGNQVGQPLLKTNPNVGPLNDAQQKSVNDAQNAAATARQQYQQTASLAQQLANAPDFSSGFGASVDDTLTRLTGNKDAGQQLRGQLSQFANSAILGELPPGSASDKDIELVRNGVPSDTASKATWQSYLAAVGRVQKAAAVFQNGRADYITANRGDLGPLKLAGTINGQQYGVGTTLAQALSGQGPQQQSGGGATGAVPYGSLVAEARRRGLLQ